MRWNQNRLSLNRTRLVTVKVKPKVAAKPVIVSPSNKSIKYTINDPSTPTLMKNVPAPAILPAPKFTVLGYRGGGYDANSVAGQAANVYYTIANTINNLNTVADKKLVSWAGTSNLNIKPRAGRRLNAYYDRRSLQFFYYFDPEKNQDMYTADSTDIVAHELGHAILDSYRPDLWSVASLEAWAFHEAFGDLMGMMAVMSHDEVLRYVYDQTGGNLRQYNLVSGIAEEFGRVVSQYDSSRNRNWLRNAINDFKYINPTTLPHDADDERMTSEPHSFSRIMLGTFYDLWASFYEYDRSNGVEPIQAMKNARNTLARYTINGIQKAPNTVRFYTSVAQAMLSVDSKLNLPWKGIMEEVFSDRNIIGVSSLGFTEHKEHHRCCGVKLCECLPLSIQSHNPLYEVEIQLPNKEPDSILTAKKMLDYLHLTNSVSDEENAPFELLDGKLVRSFFWCGCGTFRNQSNPTQPEYLKPYKPQNNAGCCGSCKKKTDVVVKRTVRKGCFTRYKTN